MRFAFIRTGFFILVAAASAVVSERGSAATVWATHGPCGGITDEIVVDPTNSKTLYAGSRGGGVFKSLSQGNAWGRASTGLSDPLVFTLVMDPTNSNILYAAGGNGVFRTTNAAVSWTEIGFLANVRQIVINPNVPTTLYAIVSQSSLFKSTDSGKTWTSQFNVLPSQSLYSIAINPTAPANMYVGAQGGVWRTTNGGTSWTLVTSGLGTNPIVQTLTINPKAANVIYAGTGTGLARSVNGGASWAALSGAPSALDLLAIDPSATNILYGTVYPGRVYSSSDSGLHWSARPGLATGFAGNLRTLTVDPTTSQQLYAGTDHGVFVSTNTGATWRESNLGLANTLVSALALDPKTPAILYAGTEYSGIYKTTNGGASWARIYNDWIDKITSIQIDPTTPTTLYASSGFGSGVLKSVNSGAAWTNPLADKIALALAIDRATPNTLYVGLGGGSSTVLKSVNGGTTWATARTGLPPAGSLQASSLSALSGTVMLTDSYNGIYISSNAGANWAANDPTTPSAASFASGRKPATTFDNFAEGFVFGAFLAAAVSTNDGTKTAAIGFARTFSRSSAVNAAASTGWTPWATATGVDQSTCTPVNALAADPMNPSGFYIGGLCGVLKATNQGGAVAALGTGLPVKKQVNALVVTPDGKTIYAGVFGGGVYSLTP